MGKGLERMAKEERDMLEESAYVSICQHANGW